MAKPDTFYFSHDYNTRNDEKIKSLIFKHGLRGYGIYWAIIEDLYNNANVLRNEYERIAYELREDKTIVESVIKDFDLFVFEGEIFGSMSVQKRLDERNAKSVKAKESVKKRWDKYERNTNVLPTQNEGNTIKEKKGEESKREEKKEILQNDILPLSPEYVKFNNWIKENAMDILNIRDQITEAEFFKLKSQNSPEMIKDVLLSMHNTKGIEKKYKSVYLTATNWIKLRNKNNQTDGKSKFERANDVADSVIAKLTGQN